jgi:hypothetical protein
MGLSLMPIVRMVELVILMSLVKAYAQQLPAQQPTGPTVEQRLGSAIAALIVENARLATELENARQTIAKLQASNNDTIAHDVALGITDNTGLYTNLGTVTLPINCGYVGNIPSMNMLNAIPALPLDETGQA